MDTLEITLKNTKPFSINSYYIGRLRVRSPEARRWGSSIHSKLVDYKQDFEKFRSGFDAKHHALHCTLVFRMPNLYNAKGEISHQAMDLSNIEKTLIDIITGIKYLDRGLDTLGIDDKFIINLNSTKIHDKDFSIMIKFTKVSNGK
ncbi:hypothetical protein M0R04_11585 [Candidatus Dojkabacteria bacterium]|jgi:hypothetical protein|nr:hypothetical protein [Candidatus Dojkabacteria bacterium]